MGTRIGLCPSPEWVQVPGEVGNVAWHLLVASICSIAFKLVGYHMVKASKKLSEFKVLIISTKYVTQSLQEHRAHGIVECSITYEKTNMDLSHIQLNCSSIKYLV